MSGTEQDLSELVGELARTTEQLRDELDADGPRLRPPTPDELLRFTTDVTIPAIILALETNVRALRLVQRTLQFAAGRNPETGGASGQARARAEALGRETLDRLDDALVDLQDALSGRPPDDEARDLLEETRDLRAEVDQRLARSGEGAGDAETVDIDVDAELQSIKDSVEDEPPDDE